jgi:hypothetical protein
MFYMGVGHRQLRGRKESRRDLQEGESPLEYRFINPGRIPVDWWLRGFREVSLSWGADSEKDGGSPR